MKRLNYLDGLKGWCAISISVMHILLLFIINGFVGWYCLPEALANPKEYYFAYFPYSILVNNSLPLYIFFAIISFVISNSFFKNQNEEKLKVKAITRYFRFLPIVFITCLISYITIKLNLCQIDEFFLLTGNTWAVASTMYSPSFLVFLKETLFTSYFLGTDILSPLWCLDYLFLGSMLTYFIMFIFNKISKKYLFLGFIAILFLLVNPNYLAFILGIIVAVVVNNGMKIKKIYSILLIILGIIIGCIPPVILPSFISIYTLYSIGAALILLGTHCSFKNNYFLNNRFIVFLGKESLSVILVEFLILQAVNPNLYILFNSLDMNNALNIVLNISINLILTVVLTFVCSKTITPLTNFICKKGELLIIKKESNIN